MEKPILSPKNESGIFYARIPHYDALSAAERAAIIGHGYPVQVMEHLPEHEHFADYLIEQGFDASTRSQG